MMNILPANCQHAASINYSILDNGFNPANIYRFFCISLYRDDWYYVRVTLDDIKKLTGDKSLSKFNNDFREYLEIKMYYLDKGYAYKTKRNLYHIPAMEKECITISKNFLMYELNTAVKGFFIQLILLFMFSDITLEKKNITSTLNMDKDTYDKYLYALRDAGLVTNGKVLVLHTDGILLENDYSEQKKLARGQSLNMKDTPKVEIKSIKP